MKGLYNIFEYLKSEFEVCSANNFLSFSSCKAIYLFVGLIIFCIIASRFEWDKTDEEKKKTKK